MINEEKCPISLEKIEYPCYPYKINDNMFRYYKLHFLKTYLIIRFENPVKKLTGKYKR